MTVVLTPEQVHDAQRMANEPDLPNFSKAGTGKTHTTLEAIRLSGLQQHLIVAPPIAVGWWVQQAIEYLGADAREMKTATSPLAGDVLVTTYTKAASAKARLYEHYDGGTLTLDESQYVCNPETARTQAVYGPRCDVVGGIAECFDTVWNLSGTPKMNHANDYYTQAAVLHPEIFEAVGVTNYEEFCRAFTYSRKKQFNPRMAPTWKISGSTNEALLHKLVYKDLNAIRREEAPNMPKLLLRELEVPVKLNKELRDAVKGLSDAEIIAKMNDPDGIIAKAWKLTGLAKVESVVPYVGDCLSNGPVLLGCWHHEVMDAYVERLTKKGFSVVKVAGDTPANQIDNIRNAFNDGHIQVLVGQMRKMGVSWNLQEACTQVIIAEEYPSPSVIEQFYKRVYRRGQKNACTVDIILGENAQVDQAFHGVRLRKEESDVKIG